MNTFQSNIISIYGEQGKVWLNELPELVRAISSRFELRDLKAVTNLTYNYVLSGFQGNNPIILKLGLDNEALAREAFALKCFAGCGAVKVLAEDEGMLLLDRAVPGTSLRGVYDEAIQEFSGSRRFARDDEAIEIACRVVKKLHQASIPVSHNFPHIKDWLMALDSHCEELATKQSRTGSPRCARDDEAIEIVCGIMKKLHQASIPVSHNFPHIKDWLAALDRHCEEFTTKQSRTGSPRCARDDELLNYLQKARKLRDQLLQTSEVDVLLHGDLHHDNILQNGDEWLVIDPKGVIGSPMNEIWAFVMDIERDIPFIAQYFNYRTQDLFDWYFVHVILAACWNLEDNIDANLFLRLADKAHKYVS